MRAWVKNVLAALIATVVCAGLLLILLEAYLQATYHAPEPRGFEYSPSLGWENKKQYSATYYSEHYGRDITASHNSVGIRDAREFTLQGEKPRIAIIGDSFVYGMGLDQNDTIGRRLQERLPEHEVISAGTIGYSTTQYLQYYDLRIRPYRPRIVVLVVYINDFSENRLRYVFGYPKPWAHVIDENGGLAKYAIDIPPQPEPTPPERPRLMTPTFAKTAWRNLQGEKESYYASAMRKGQGWWLMEQTPDGDTDYTLLLEYNILAEANRTISADNATMVVVYVPVRWQVDTGYREQLFRRFNDTRNDTFDYTRVNTYLRDYQRRIQYPYLDLTPAMARHEDVGRLYLPDGHLSPEGTAFFDEQLLALLRMQGLVPASS